MKELSYSERSNIQNCSGQFSREANQSINQFYFWLQTITMRASIALAILCLVCAPPVSSFVISPHCRSPTRLEATKAKAKSKKKAPTSSGGFGTKKDVKAPFNAAVSVNDASIAMIGSMERSDQGPSARISPARP